ncbi:MAG TPA: type II toxin-antitoxin system VapC family toxin [Sphingomicrobium sp.]|nr:type II toxin-antitoxin system VapC family toxin [Sphingomicrobium sp.]
MILVDTSIWIDHINKGFNDHLSFLLLGESVVMHNFVIGEIAMGSIKNRRRQLEFFDGLHKIATAEDREVRLLVESASFHGTGLSFVDAHLLTAARASADAEPVRIWTRDKPLYEQAKRLGIAYAP